MSEKLATRSSNDAFDVFIQNLTDGTLTPRDGGVHFDYGRFSDDGDPLTVNPYRSGAVPRAFHVQGKVGAGVQGQVKYNVDSLALANLQFNSDVGGSASDYFYAGLQPQSANAEVLGHYLEVQDFSIPVPVGQVAFRPRVIVRPSAPPYQVAALPYPQSGRSSLDKVFLMEVVNATGDLMTLNRVDSPLDEYFQPAFATTVVPTDGAAVYLATFATPFAPGLKAAAPGEGARAAKTASSDIDVVYNLARGVQITIRYTGDGSGPASASFSGENSGRYHFDSTSTTFVPPTLRKLRITLSLTPNRP